jgi:AcrR family transcriptional regulator
VLTFLPLDPLPAESQGPRSAAEPATLSDDIRQRHDGKGATQPWSVNARIESRRATLREVGARLLASRGIDRVSMLEIALTAGVTPYAARSAYLRRHDLIFDILHAFVDALHEYVGTADEGREGALGEIRLEAVTAALLDGIFDHRDAHQISRSAFPLLTGAERETLQYQLRTLAYRIGISLTAALPGLESVPELRQPLIQSLIAMASHAPFWMKDDGPLQRGTYARMIAQTVIEGGRVQLADQRQGTRPVSRRARKAAGAQPG